ncbi:serine O-acetyltransferase [Desulfofustis glycolicus]
MRTTRFLKEKGGFLLPLTVLCRLWLRRLQFKYGISLPYNTEIDRGLYIGHYGGIVINHQSVIGKNCNLNHNVTIGATYGGKLSGTPKIGDNVYIGPGSFIIGGIYIGHNVAVGANTVVTKSVPDNGVVAGPLGEVISYKGSGNYVINTDY